jgi:hypothetical protein
MAAEADRIEGYATTQADTGLGRHNRKRVAWLREQAAAPP